MKSLSFCLALAITALSSSATRAHASGSTWSNVGPDGGDARRIAADPTNPKHLYLGTVNSWLYQSNDGGSSWKRVSKLAKQDNLVIDSIVVDSADPKTVLVGAWVFDRPGGSLFISHDAGLTWTAPKDMEGQSIRALVEARSDAGIYVAGTLTGVYRSEDHGQHWKLISPEGSNELHEVESIAIDPADPKTIFAGTWHLPWKTTDGGANWHTIKQGVIDDSDVFSIIVDPKVPATMYASACSGIYKSLNAGELFAKVQGIPATARRTRVLMQDPVNLDVVYAGTTEGLYQTTNAGAQWSRITGPDVVVNDVYVDPTDRTHVIMATDRSGVLVSSDAGVTFHDGNAGFSQRQIDALLTDPRSPHVMYVGVLNDKTYGGVFVSEDDGAHWKQQSDGLGGLDVFSLAEAGDGTLFAGTSHGLFRWSGHAWERNGTITAVSTNEPVSEVAPKSISTEGTSSKRSSSQHVRATKSAASESKVAMKTPTKKKSGKPELPVQIDSRVNSLAVAGDVWYAATSTGVYRSMDKGATWQEGTGQPVVLAAVAPPKQSSSKARHTKASAPPPPPPAPPQPAINYLFVDASGPVVYAASRDAVTRSADGGKTWQAVPSSGLTSIEALAGTPAGQVWIGGREGLFYSDDKGDSWQQLKGLPTVGITGLTYDLEQKRLVVSSRHTTLIFAIDTTDRTWKWWDAGSNIRAVRWANGRLLGISRYDGIVIQPGAGDSTASAASGGH